MYLSNENDEDQYIRQKGGRHGEAAGVIVDGEIFVQDEVPAVPPGVDVLLSRAGEEGGQPRYPVVVPRIQSQQPAEESLFNNVLLLIHIIIFTYQIVCGIPDAKSACS